MNRTFAIQCWTMARVRKNCGKCQHQPQCKEEVTVYAHSLGVSNFEWQPPYRTKTERQMLVQKMVESLLDKENGITEQLEGSGIWMCQVNE